MSAIVAYAKKIAARLEELDADINRMKARAKSAGADAQLEYMRHLSELRQKRDEAGRRLEKLRAAGDGATADVQAGLENAWKDLKDAVDQAKRRFQ